MGVLVVAVVTAVAVIAMPQTPLPESSESATEDVDQSG
jgi:hypothetical protein